MITNCNICNTTSRITFKSLLKDLPGIGNYTQEICLCKQCGFIYVKKPLSQEQYDEQYKNFSKYEFDIDKKNEHLQKEYLKRCLQQKSFIENSIDLNSVKSILEIGASSGLNLTFYKDKQVFGVEPSKKNCDNAKKMYSIDMFAGTFAEYIQQYPANKFDLIFLSGTLEHIVNPCDFVKSCSHINNKYFFVDVPTFDYKFKDEPFGMFTDEHVNMFTFESLQNCMNAAGYSIVNADLGFSLGDNIPSGYPALRTIWQKTSKVIQVKPVQSSQQLFKSYLKWSKTQIKAIDKKIKSLSNSSKVALWGIGNTAARLLGHTSLRKKNIVRCYDSDKRKHGCLFAGAEITSFDEKDIKDGVIDTVIITTCTAQKTLQKILKPYQKQINVIILFNTY